MICKDTFVLYNLYRLVFNEPSLVHRCGFGSGVVDAVYTNGELVCTSSSGVAVGVEMEVSVNGVNFTQNRLLFTYYSAPTVSNW